MDFDLRNLYFTADWHYNHANIIGYCNRPFADIHEMNSSLVYNYNQVVGKDDTCIFVGDFMFYGTKTDLNSLLSSMNGTKVLVKGNHDWIAGKRQDYIDAGFSIYTKSLVVAGYRVVHDPKRVPNFDETKFIVGHVHDHWVTKGNMVNAGVDVWDFKPVHFSILDMVSRFGKAWRVMGINRKDYYESL